MCQCLSSTFLLLPMLGFCILDIPSDPLLSCLGLQEHICRGGLDREQIQIWSNYSHYHSLSPQVSSLQRKRSAKYCEMLISIQTWGII